MVKEKTIAYIGEFDLRNENVQAHLVKNNGRILNELGYRVCYVGVNRNVERFSDLETLPNLSLGINEYLELPNTLNTTGAFKAGLVCKKILLFLKRVCLSSSLEFVITYQAPTYAIVLKKIAIFCREQHVPYIVNCADLPIFELQSFVRRTVMRLNWDYMYRINKKYANGVIAVSHYISDFYNKTNRPCVIIPPLFDESSYRFKDAERGESVHYVYAGLPFVVTGHEADPKGMKDRLDKVIDIFLHLSNNKTNYRFTIIGISKEDYLSGVPRHRDSLIKEERIEFLGRRSHDETLKLVHDADFTINYRDENLMTKAGFSTKLVESVSVGTPVVANEIGDIKCYLEEGISWYKLSGIIEDDVKTVRELSNLSIAYRRKIKEKLRGMKVFSVEKYKNHLSAFLETCQ